MISACGWTTVNSPDFETQNSVCCNVSYYIRLQLPIYLSYINTFLVISKRLLGHIQPDLVTVTKHFHVYRRLKLHCSAFLYQCLDTSISSTSLVCTLIPLPLYIDTLISSFMLSAREAWIVMVCGVPH